MIWGKAPRGLVCVLIDGENIAHPYKQYGLEQELNVFRNLFAWLDTWLRRRELLAGIGCRKVFLARSPSEFVRKIFHDFGYQIILSTYSGEDAADKQMILHGRELYQVACPRYVKEFVLVSSDQIFVPFAQELKDSRFGTVRIGSQKLSEAIDAEIMGPFDTVVQFWSDSFGGHYRLLK